jgi:ATP/maltotriose-dependent transcriptional regulator MalT
MVFFRGWSRYERGRLREAEADLELAGEMGMQLDPSLLPAGALLALVYAEDGRFDQADQVLHGLGLEGELPKQQVLSLALMWRARTRLLQRRPDEALADLLEVGARYDSFGIRRAVPPWRSLAAALLTGTGDHERALELARDEVELAEHWGTPLAMGTARRGLGLVSDDVAELERAVELLEQSPARLELARARADLGAALRRDGRRAESREPLRLAMDEAHACGASVLAERARDELRATGARPRRLALSGADALTASESRVARLAAEGMTNRQIAQELFVTTATVETHRRHAFQKHEVAGRDELGQALAA